uniref:Uncharacterized protein n=1 Tax=Bracon brevicornis TaxID=1563983 RepID=A0A6V7LNN3_9HYME
MGHADIVLMNEFRQQHHFAFRMTYATEEQIDMGYVVNDDKTYQFGTDYKLAC